MRILFQGDSITDAGRNRESDHNRGDGYATLVSARLGFEHPGKYEFINRGISGNRVVDLVGRLKRDIVHLKPDVMSILIGVNDVWHEFEVQNGVDAELYEKLYDLLIEEVKRELPHLRIMIMEPFLLKGEATSEKWDEFRCEVELRAAAAKRVAEKHGLEFIPLQELFDAAREKAPESYWLIDGVHPSAMGHELIAREWIKVFFGKQND